MVAPVISTVIATTVPWPEVSMALRSVYTQTIAHGGEVILADGTGRGLPQEHDFPAVRHLVLLGRNVFRLRAAGLTAARGAIVALTEDHCRVAPDWIAAILRAHAEHPEAAIIGGAVRNGAVLQLIDWASFFVSHALYLPPVDVRAGANITGQANVSYKRQALERYPADALEEGRFRRELIAGGGRLIADDRILVDHVQSLGVRHTLSIHYHDGRCVAAAHQARAGRIARLSTIGKALLWPIRVPLASGRVIVRALRKSPLQRVAVLSAPWIVSVVACHKVGEVVGALAGAGRSPDRMR
jgi:hypothetical protein